MEKEGLLILEVTKASTISEQWETAVDLQSEGNKTNCCNASVRKDLYHYRIKNTNTRHIDLYNNVILFSIIIHIAYFGFK